MADKNAAPAVESAEGKSSKKFIGNFFNKYGIFLILLLLVLIMSALTKGLFLNPINMMNIVRQVSFIGLIGVGVTCIILTTGIDLASGSILALGAVVAGSLAHPGSNIIVAVLAGLAAATVAGLISGLIIAYWELPPFIVTLGMMTAARGVAMLYTNGKPIGDLQPAFVWLGAGSLLWIPVPIALLLIATIFTYIVLNKTRFGRHIYAVGGNEQAAIISGVNVKKIKIVVYAYAGLLAGLAGISLSARIQSAQPGAGLGYELDGIAGAVIGGTSQAVGGIGTVQGTVVGVLIIGVINNGMNLMGVNSYWQQIVKAAIIIGAVLLDKKRTKA
jgi:inositol transport system permease protein